MVLGAEKGTSRPHPYAEPMGTSRPHPYPFWIAGEMGTSGSHRYGMTLGWKGSSGKELDQVADLGLEIVVGVHSLEDFVADEPMQPLAKAVGGGFEGAL